jgi:hypothetical protein
MLEPFIRKEYIKPLERQCLWVASHPNPFKKPSFQNDCGPEHIADWIDGRGLPMHRYWLESPQLGSTVRAVLYDLVLFVGSSPGPGEPTLLESWQAQGAWLDDSANRCEWPRAQPRGPLAIRLAAVNLAFSILYMMHHVRFAWEAGEADSGHGLANLLLSAHRPAMLACLHRMLGKWPAIYSKRWFEAYRAAVATCRHLRPVGS